MKRYESPAFDKVKYDGEDVLLLSDNKELSAADKNGFGGLVSID